MEVIVVAHSKGGTGKSTIIWNLAHFIRSLDKPTIIIDLDFQQTQHYLHRIRTLEGLTNPQNDIPVFRPQTADALINTLENFSDHYILIDVGGYDNDINRIAISWADKIVVPLSDSITDVLGFKTFENILKEIDNPFINIVLNNIHPLTKNFNTIKEAIGSNEDIKLLDTVIRTRKIYKTTMGEGKSVFDINHTVAQDEIKGLYYEIISN
ncbi:MAG: ParA family protein [Arcobacteraceae bacterium]|nr:ParA family protein [Arcobacteraceae bacterium]